MVLTKDNLKDFNYEIIEEKDGLHLKYCREECTCFYPTKSNITALDDNLFENIVNDFTAFFPKNIKKIGNSAFKNCKNLKELTFNEGVEYIGEDAFLGCDIRKEVIFPESLKMIDKRCFSFNENLETVIFKGKNTIIAHNMFTNCIKLENIELPENLNVLPDSIFFNCYSLKNVDLKNTKTIGYTAFFNCVSLEKLILPKTIEEINRHFIHFDESLISDALLKPSYKVQVFNNSAYSNVTEKLSKNKFVIMQNMGIDELLDENKSFKEINKIYKDVER